MNIFSFTKFIANVYPIARMLQAPCLGFKARACGAQSSFSHSECRLEDRNIKTFSNDLIHHLSRFLNGKERMNLLSINKNCNTFKFERPLTLILPNSDDAPLSDMIRLAVEAKLKIAYAGSTFPNIYGKNLPDSNSALWGWAVLEKHINLLHALKAYNAINIHEGCFGSPIMYDAVLSGSEKVCATLLTFDVNIEARMNGLTPLHVAVIHNHQPIVKILLANNAKTDVVDNECRTPLHLAVIHNHQLIVKILLANNAKTDVVDNEGRTPLHLAVIRNHQLIVKILLANNAVKILLAIKQRPTL